MRDIDDPLHDECSAEPEDRQPCGRRYNTIGKWECKARGCCYDDRDRVEEGTIHCFLAHRKFSYSFHTSLDKLTLCQNVCS